MKSLLSALVLSAASVFPVSAGIHDYNPTNAAPGKAECITYTDNSELCYLEISPSNYSIAIKEISQPVDIRLSIALMNCNTGQMNAFTELPLETVNSYLREFCTEYD